MIDVRIEVEDAPITGRCCFCWQRLDWPERVVARPYADGEPIGGLACPECLALDDDALRATMRETADWFTEKANEMRAAASGPIQRPAPGVLVLERLHRLPAPVVIDRIG